MAIQSDLYRHQNAAGNKLTLYGAGIMVLLIFAWSYACGEHVSRMGSGRRGFDRRFADARRAKADEHRNRLREGA